VNGNVICFGEGKDVNCNVLLDATHGVSYLNEIYDLLKQGFNQFLSHHGILAQEKVRGVKFILVDAKVHSDSSHRGAAQIIPATRRALSACMMSGNVRLMEPMYRLNVTFPYEIENDIRRVLGSRECIDRDYMCLRGNSREIIADIPVIQSLGFASELRQATKARAFPSFVFENKWKLINDNPFDNNSRAYQLCIKVRERKDIKAAMPNFNDYYDKI
jgi:elongation factor 2